jgi:transcriptional regulator NrdR family protein
MRNCPECKAKLKTTQTRQASQHPDWVRRRRVCVANCGFRLTTIELPMADLTLEQQGEVDGVEGNTESDRPESGKD